MNGNGISALEGVLEGLGVRVDLAWGRRRNDLTREVVTAQRGSRWLPGDAPAAVLQFTFGSGQALLAIKTAHAAKGRWHDDWFWWSVPKEDLVDSLGRFDWRGLVVVFLAEEFFETTAGFSAQSTREVVKEAAMALGNKPKPLPNAAFGWVEQEELKLARRW